MLKQKSFGRFLITLTLVGVMLISAVSPALAVDTSNGFVHQEKTNWCWAACSVSMLQCGSVSVTQTQFANAVFGNTDNVPRAMDAVCAGFQSVYHLPTYYQNGGLNNYNVEYYIDINSPIFARIGWPKNPDGSDGGGHFVLISGYVTSGYTIKVMDPLDSKFVIMPLYTFTTNYKNDNSGSGGIWTHSFYYTV